jgi:hypothetical protein
VVEFYGRAIAANVQLSRDRIRGGSDGSRDLPDDSVKASVRSWGIVDGVLLLSEVGSANEEAEAAIDVYVSLLYSQLTNEVASDL